MDPNSVEITIHALERFEERKKGKARKNPERQIRLLLAQSRELLHFKGYTDGTQFFIVDPWCFVIKDDCVITVYTEGYITNPQLKRKQKGFSHRYLRAKSSNQKWRWH